MTAILKTDVIEKNDGSPVNLTGQSAAKGWVHMNPQGALSIDSSFNISSVTDFGIGYYGANWISAFTVPNHPVVNACDNQVDCLANASTTLQDQIYTRNYQWSYEDGNKSVIVAFGDLT